MKSWTVLIWSNDCDLFKPFKIKENIGPKHDRKCVAQRVISEKWYTRENFTPVCLFVPPKAQIGSTKAAVHKIMNILTPEKATCWCRKLLLSNYFLLEILLFGWESLQNGEDWTKYWTKYFICFNWYHIIW